MEPRTEVVAITGASAGLGRALAREFAAHGARVGLVARSSARLAAAEAELRAQGFQAHAASCDVAYPEQVEAAAEAVERELGPIDIWVNNAMTTIFGRFTDISPAEFKRATEVTYLGFVYGTMAALRRMKPRNRGTIVQVGSALAYRSIPLQSPYCGAKHAIVGFTDSLRSELLHDGIDVHLAAVHLPAMNTPQFSWCRTRLPRHPQPVPPIFEPEVAARAIYWAAHSTRREVFVGWPTVKAIYGGEIVPGYADRYLARNGFDSQQTGEPVSPDRPDNLFESVPADFAAHGIFTGRSRLFSLQSWLDMHRTALAALGGGITAALAAGFYFGRR